MEEVLYGRIVIDLIDLVACSAWLGEKVNKTVQFSIIGSISSMPAVQVIIIKNEHAIY